MSELYQDLWDADQGGNGVPALRPNERRDTERGFVIVDERSIAVGAEHQVLAEVLIPESKRQTYLLCERLFDNYALERAAREQIDDGEMLEITDFIDAILPTDVIQLAKRQLERHFERQFSDLAIAAMIKETWFAMGRAGSQSQASGFEHVFVGEQASSATGVGGYHFWYKYYVDDGGQGLLSNGSADRIEYFGTRYHGAQEPGKGILVPEVVTLQLAWRAPFGDQANADPDGEKRLRKPIGGFFVGCSPEGLIALGLIRARTRIGEISKINGAEYKLDFHPLDDMPSSIRTFFPRFRKADIVAIDNAPSGGTGGDTGTVEGEAAFRITAGMINPVNPEGGREFLQLINVFDADQNLAGWQIEAPNGIRFTLADNIVQPGHVFRFHVPSAEGILRNRGGTITLIAPDGAIVQTCEYTQDQARREGRVILF
jgi:hypothetical protein